MVDRGLAGVATRPSLVELLTLAQRRIARGLAPAFAEEDCSIDQWRVMRALSDGEGHSMGELADELMIAHPTLTRIVDGLVDSSLVYRRQSAGDRRRVAVYLSRRGQTRLSRLDALAAAHEDAVRSTPEWAELSSLLRRLGDR